jgi:AraC-like DNA-binding protein
MNYVITARVFAPLRSFTESKGVDFTALAAKVGFEDTEHIDPDSVVPLQPVLDLFEFAAKASGDPLFGMHFGELLPAGSLGLYNFIVVNSPTLRDALHACRRYVMLAVNAGHITFIESEGAGYYTWHFPDCLEHRTQYVGFVLAITMKRMEYILQRAITPLRIDLEFSEPVQLAEVHRLLGPNLQFNTSPTRIVIASSDLDAATVSANPFLYEQIEGLASTNLSRKECEPSLLDTISDVIAKGLQSGRTTQADVCATLAMTPRTLQRALDELGVTFRELLDDIRKQVARHLLADTAVPLSEIAFRLGYSELSVFSRAAKQWFGQPPSKIRQMGSAATRNRTIEGRGDASGPCSYGQ